MGPAEAMLMQNYGDVSARLKALKPPKPIAVPDPVDGLKDQINYLRQDLETSAVKDTYRYVALKNQIEAINEKIDAVTKDLIKAIPELKTVDRADLIAKGRPVHSIIAFVGKTEKIAIHHIIGQRRLKKLCAIRHIAVYLATELTGKSLPEIGRVFGGRDHTTILHARDKIARLRLTDPALDEKIKFYEGQLGQA